MPPQVINAQGTEVNNQHANQVNASAATMKNCALAPKDDGSSSDNRHYRSQEMTLSKNIHAISIADESVAR